MKKVLFFSFIFLFCMSAFAVTIESKQQELLPDKNKGFFTGDVKVMVGDVEVTSPRAELDLEPKTKKPSLATFFDKPYAIQVKANKKHEVKADIISVSLINKVIRAQGRAQTNVLENGQPTVIITSDEQEYDTNTRLMKALGSVVVNYQDMTASSDEAYALMDKNNDIQNLKLNKKASIKQEKNLIRADNIQYSKLRNDIIATGNTMSDITLDNSDRVIVYANSQQYNNSANTLMASGKVHVLYSDYVADGPKAVVHLNKENKPEKIIFLGRSKIVEKGTNSVEADKITLTVSPKTFSAEGKVKTTIEQDNTKQDDNLAEFSL